MNFIIVLLFSLFSYKVFADHSLSIVLLQNETVSENTITWDQYLKLFPHIEVKEHSKFHFLENLKYVIEHNSVKRSYKLGVTQFMHLSDDEWKSMFHNITLDSQEGEIQEFKQLNLRSTPSSWDWRDHGVVTPVKNQGNRGTCYEHAAVETIETAWAIKSNDLKVLSVEQGVDCSKLNSGDNGGLPDYSYRYSINVEKCLNETYPYGDKAVSCKTCQGVISKLSSYVDIKDGDENAMFQALLINSLAVGIKADDKQFQMYKSGILDYNCDSSKDSIDHATVIEFAGIEGDVPYWGIRNSWGTSWGESGYIKMKRGVCQCGICHMASYPKF